jgi:hypothetical protein
MALLFPVGPSVGDLYPADPGISGVTQYQWDGAKWNAVISAVSLGNQNQGAYNTYKWPAADGVDGQQLTTDGAGNLAWDVPAAPQLEILSLLEPFGAGLAQFTLLDSNGDPYAPVPPSNIVVFLGGVPQIPSAAYTIGGANGDQIFFTEAPLAGTTFYAISSFTV